MDANTTALCLSIVIIIGVGLIALMALDRWIQRYNKLQTYEERRAQHARKR